MTEPDATLPIEVLEKVKAASPAKQLELQKREQLRQEMLPVMEAMEQAREKVGDFCVTIGEGEMRAVMLIEPVVIKTDDGLTETHFVFASTKGFDSVKFLEVKADPGNQWNALREGSGVREAYLHANEVAIVKKPQLIEALQNAQNGVIPDHRDPGFPNIPKIGIHELSLQPSQVDELVVTGDLRFFPWSGLEPRIDTPGSKVVIAAVENSIKKAQLPHEIRSGWTNQQLVGVGHVKPVLPKP